MVQCLDERPACGITTTAMDGCATGVKANPGTVVFSVDTWTDVKANSGTAVFSVDTWKGGGQQ